MSNFKNLSQIFLSLLFLAPLCSQQICPDLPLIGNPSQALATFFFDLSERFSPNSESSEARVLSASFFDSQGQRAYKITMDLLEKESGDRIFIGILGFHPINLKSDDKFRIAKFIQTNHPEDIESIFKEKNFSSSRGLPCGDPKQILSTFFENWKARSEKNSSEATKASQLEFENSKILKTFYHDLDLSLPQTSFEKSLELQNENLASSSGIDSPPSFYSQNEERKNKDFRLKAIQDELNFIRAQFKKNEEALSSIQFKPKISPNSASYSEISNNKLSSDQVETNPNLPDQNIGQNPDPSSYLRDFTFNKSNSPYFSFLPNNFVSSEVSEVFQIDKKNFPKKQVLSRTSPQIQPSEVPQTKSQTRESSSSNFLESLQAFNQNANPKFPQINNPNFNIPFSSSKSADFSSDSADLQHSFPKMPKYIEIPNKIGTAPIDASIINVPSSQKTQNLQISNIPSVINHLASIIRKSQPKSPASPTNQAPSTSFTSETTPSLNPLSIQPSDSFYRSPLKKSPEIYPLKTQFKTVLNLKTSPSDFNTQ